MDLQYGISKDTRRRPTKERFATIEQGFSHSKCSQTTGVIWGFVFHTGFFFRTKKNGVLLRRTVSGDSLAHFFLFGAELTLGKGEHLGMRATILVVSNLIPAIEMSMYNAKFYIINFQGIYYYYAGDQKTKRMGFIFFGFKTGFFVLFLHIDLAFRTL